MQKLCNCIVIGFIVISEGTSWSGEPVGWENRLREQALSLHTLIHF